jgi:aarF domain-containing kinase
LDALHLEVANKRVTWLMIWEQSKVLQNCVRIKLARMIQALANKEDGAIARALLDLGLVFEDINGGVVSESRLATMARILFDTCYVAEATVSPMSQDSLLRTTPLRAFNQAIWMVVRTLVILRGMCFALKMDLSATTIWLPFAQAALQSEDNS